MSRLTEDDAIAIDPEHGRIYSVGHSTRSVDDFIALLQAHRIEQLADVRAIPASRRWPHFSADALAKSLNHANIAYRHFPALGGRRHPRADSTNNAWQHPSFRGYADYMETPAFAAAIDDLLRYAESGATVVMCAEAVWWSCHRRLIADALTVRGIDVRHIMTTAPAASHELTPFARVNEQRLSYPSLLDPAE